MVSAFRSSSGLARLQHVARVLRGLPPDQEVLVVGATREAVNDFIRILPAGKGATFGLHRFTLLQLAAHLSATELARQGLTAASALGSEAVAARATFEAWQAGRLSYFGPVATFPGFARALARTLDELRAGGVTSRVLRGLGPSGADLAELLVGYEAQLTDARVADRAALLKSAAGVVRAGGAAWLHGLPLVLVDVPVRRGAEQDFLAALVERAGEVSCTLPQGDEETRKALGTMARARVVDETTTLQPNSLTRLQQHLFSEETPPEADADETVRFFSAPGESRECVEIARAILGEARAGVHFDDVAILLRDPQAYTGLLENALRRASIPAYFAPGTSRPDPSGRAFLAVLACAAEGLSARRFAEYLSLGQVPALKEDGAPPPPPPTTENPGPQDERLGPAAVAARKTRASRKKVDPAQLALFDLTTTAPVAATPPPSTSPDAPVLEGTLRAPWRWEELLVEAAVMGGRERWRRRLDGLEAELRVRLRELQKEDGESPRITRLQRDLADLGHLRRFALPLMDELSALPRGLHGGVSTGTWGEWIAALQRLAPMVLRKPDRVLATLADLQPMSAIGPVTLTEVLAVLTEQLSLLEHEPPERRFGRVFVGTPEQARGRTFQVVFIPGLCERVFPRKPHEDPLLLDQARTELNQLVASALLQTQETRVDLERLLLRLATGAASRRVYLSYSRIQMPEARARVPSFYALDVQRAVTGRIPSHEELEREAARESGARLAWPAPTSPDVAIDEAEHDLATLYPLLHSRTANVNGRARYLLQLNPHLARSLRSQWARWQDRWSPHDGLIGHTPATLAALTPHRLTQRPYSVSALQKYASCPYQFLLSAIHGLEPRKDAVPLEQMDPLTRGSMFHRVQAETLRELERLGELPLKPSSLSLALAKLDGILEVVSRKYGDDLAPAIMRVWNDGVEAMRTDLRTWLWRLAQDDSGWVPIRFELGIGVPRGEEQDPRSIATPATLPGGLLVRGIVDLVEERAGKLRVTDYKTGANRTNPGLVVGEGLVLQPVIYGMAMEAVTGQEVSESRLYFCTTTGAFSERAVPMGPLQRMQGLEVLQAVDEAIAAGSLPPAPRERGCQWCDFREVCGPHEEQRIARKRERGRLEKLEYVRSLP
ncbi:MAG: PD-(D/E)XK nuclease family protein [Myxococcota bacterium]